MASIVLVALQFALIAALLWPGGSGGWSIAAIAPIGAGIVLGLWALAVNRPGNFNIRPEPKDGGRLVDGGPYRYVRHPMYSALLLAALGLVLHDPTPSRALLLAALAVVLHVKARVEESALLARRPGYASYLARTARWIPFLW